MGLAVRVRPIPNNNPQFSHEQITLCQPISKLVIVVPSINLKNLIKITMAGRLRNVASQIMGGNGVVGRSVASSLRLRSGMGLPVGKHIVPDKPVSCNFHFPHFSDHKHISQFQFQFKVKFGCRGWN